MNFDEKLEELEKIISKLESGEVKFDEAVSMFEKGALLCQELSKTFDEASGKVTVLKEQLNGLIEEEMK